MKNFYKKTAIITLAVLLCFQGLAVKAVIDLDAFTGALTDDDVVVAEAFSTLAELPPIIGDGSWGSPCGTGLPECDKSDSLICSDIGGGLKECVKSESSADVTTPSKDSCGGPAEGEVCGKCKAGGNCNSGLTCLCDTGTGVGEACKNDPAAQCQKVGEPTICPLSTYSSFDCLLNSVSKYILYVGLILAPLMILIGAFYMLTSAGEPRRSTQGKTIITWALVGLAVILTAKAFISIITTVIK